MTMKNKHRNLFNLLIDKFDDGYIYIFMLLLLYYTGATPNGLSGSMGITVSDTSPMWWLKNEVVLLNLSAWDYLDHLGGAYDLPMPYPVVSSGL